MISETSSGGMTANDVLMHSTVLDLPFGGVGEPPLPILDFCAPAAASDPGSVIPICQFSIFHLHFSIKYIFRVGTFCEMAY